MENSNIIFKNDSLEIFWWVGSTPNNGMAKAVRMKCKAINPNDGKEYERYAGWIGLSLALHGGPKTRTYINDAACNLIQDHKNKILPAIIDFLEAKGNHNRANDFREANGISAGNGVNFKTAHPFGENQRQKVRTMMQQNAPIGTNHS